MLKINLLVKKHVCTVWCDHAYIHTTEYKVYVGAHGGCLVCKTVVIRSYDVCLSGLVTSAASRPQGGRKGEGLRLGLCSADSMDQVFM